MASKVYDLFLKICLQNYLDIPSWQRSRFIPKRRTIPATGSLLAVSILHKPDYNLGNLESVSCAVEELLTLLEVWEADSMPCK